MSGAHTVSRVALYNRSCERMAELEDDCVDLIVTSPPYFIDPNDAYVAPAQLREHDAAPPVPTYGELLEMLSRCFAEVYRVLKPGGFCAVNVASTRVNGKLCPLPFDLVVRMLVSGWELREEFIWWRWRSWDRRAGHLISRPYPGFYFPSRVHEHVLLFAKAGPAIHEGKPPAEKEESRLLLTGDFYAHEVANSVWNILPVQPANRKGHPCPFPEELAYRLIALYSYKNDLILDPFMGSGTVGKVARLLGRRFAGYEVHPAFVRLAQERIQETEVQRERSICRFEKAASMKGSGTHASQSKMLTTVL
jgi:DNA modification methylase